MIVVIVERMVIGIGDIGKTKRAVRLNLQGTMKDHDTKRGTDMMIVIEKGIKIDIGIIRIDIRETIIRKIEIEIDKRTGIEIGRDKEKSKIDIKIKIGTDKEKKRDRSRKKEMATKIRTVKRMYLKRYNGLKADRKINSGASSTKGRNRVKKIGRNIVKEKKTNSMTNTRIKLMIDIEIVPNPKTNITIKTNSQENMKNISVPVVRNQLRE